VVKSRRPGMGDFKPCGFMGASFSAAVLEKCNVVQTSLRNKRGVWKK